MANQERRQRVQRACDECKRKKKQCSGSRPCPTCMSRSFPCVFSNVPSKLIHSQHAAAGHTKQKTLKRKFDSSEPISEEPVAVARPPGIQTPLNVSIPQDEPSIKNTGRLLQDSGGRLLYIGDSAALSFLQSIRRLVEGSLGSSAFSMDFNSYKIVEALISTPPRFRHTFALPDLEAACYLVDSFFNNTVGLFEIFDRETFMAKVLDTYKHPLAADSQWLGQLNLVFAVGMQMRQGNPSPSSAEGSILQRLEAGNVKRSEIFYLTAKHLRDPICGLEDGDFTSVQSLLLTTVFMLSAAKRNTAWVYLGMAIRLAYALGIHKEETLAIFEQTEQESRRKLWQSLYILDCFLSASLGRPNGISSTCVSELCPSTSLDQSKGENSSMFNLLVSVNASKITSEILSCVYEERRASPKIAYELSLQFSEWIKKLPAQLHWRHISLDRGNPELTLRRLHINLIYFHRIILLTRPFLLYEINLQLKRSADHDAKQTPDMRPQSAQAQNGKPDNLSCFHGACIRSAINTITAVHAAFMSEALPKRDPFVIYWLFSASLIVLANKFCCVYYEHDGDTAIQMALKIFHSSATVDAQARRYLTILEAFNETVQASHQANVSAHVALDGWAIFDVLFGGEGGGPADVEPALAQNNLAAGQAQIQPWPVSEIREREYGTAVENGKLVEAAPWQDPLSNITNDGIDFDGLWWSGGQDNFTPTNDIRVSLYGLIEPS